MSEPIVRVLADPAAVAAECARRVIEELRERQGPFSLALAGGSTPKAAYALLAGALAGEVDWSRVSIYFGDERCVPPDHADSNFRMAKESLLDPLAQNRHAPVLVARMEGERPPEDAARDYAAQIGKLGPGKNPVFDLILLGMGPDGHTASLFPSSSALSEKKLAVAATFVPRLSVHRLTLTYPTLNAARAIVVMATGAEKAEALRLAIEGAPGAVPLRDVRPSAGTMTILCDRAAAASLTR